MVTGASTADLAMILVDARKGVLEQSRRHAFIASLLRIPHLVVCVNKMDLVDYDEDVFDAIRDEFSRLAGQARHPRHHLHPDLRAARRQRGRPLREHALVRRARRCSTTSSTCTSPPTATCVDARFPVQWVIRPMTDEHHDYRGYAGQVAAGVLRPGDEVVVLPSGIDHADRGDRHLRRRRSTEAFPPMSVTLRLEDDIDVSRGDMICRPHNRPTEARELDAMVCWMADGRCSRGALPDQAHHAHRAGHGRRRSRYRIDVNTLHRDESANGARAQRDRPRRGCALSTPLFVDDYRRNRATGSFILIDEATNDTVGAGMVL